MHRPSARSRIPASVAALLLAALTSSAAFGATPPASDIAAEAYLEGRFALAEDDLDLAARRFDDALKADGDVRLQRRAFEVALLAGDMKSAVRLANRIPLASVAAASQADTLSETMVALTRATGAAHAGNWRGYDAARVAFEMPARGSESGQILASLLLAYGQAGRGQFAAAIEGLDALSASGLTASYFAEHRAHLLAMAKRWPEAADAYAAIVRAEGANVPRLRIAAAAAGLKAAPAGARFRDQAITLLGGGAPEDPQLVQARARLTANPRLNGTDLGQLPARPTQGLALLFARIAADLGRDRAGAPALGFARLATLAAPELPDVWLVTADTLARGARPNLALEALDRLPRSGPLARIAETRRAAILAGAGRHDEAREILNGFTSRPDASAEDWSRLADVERRAGRNRDAAAAYTRALDALPADPGAAQAQLWFLRGSAYELAGEWPLAEADLRRAVQLDPGNALYLNYLGYSLLDRGLNLAEARGFIERAFKAAPDNGAIIDSMGWAEYVAGNHAEAVRLLEKARAAEPSDPTVSDHLGDALWKSGRRIEARHAWASAAALSPEPKLAAVLARKLEFGLDIALAAAPLPAAPRPK